MSWLRCGLLAMALMCAGGALAAEPLPATAGQRVVLADLDPENDAVVAPPAVIVDCEERLRQLGVVFSAAELPVKEARGKLPTCGTEQAIVYKRGPEGIRYNSAPIVSCGMALGMARLETVLNEEAQRYLGQKVARIEQGGTYNCRKMSRFALVSEHSYGNAIDIRSVTLKSGRKLTILHSFGKVDAPPKRPEALFLRAVANRLYDEGAFSVVITPFFDALHRDHIHLDQARYRVDGSRP
jgi:hypothetical protein